MPDNLLFHVEYWLPLCGTFAGVFAVLVVAQLFHRLLAGATVGDLVRDRFFECRPLRAAIGIGRFLLGLGVFAALAAFGRAVLLGYSHHQHAGGIDARLATIAACAVTAGIVLVFIRRRLRRWWNAARPQPPRVDTRIADIAEGIPPSFFTRLGLESFPSPDAALAPLGLGLRRLGAIVGWSLLLYLGAVVIWQLADLDHDPRFAAWPVLPLQELLDALAQLQREWAVDWPLRSLVAAIYTAAVLFFLLRRANPHYLLLRAPTHWLLLTGFAGIASVGLLQWPGPPVALGAGALFLLLLLGRLRADLRLARREKRRRHVAAPLVEALSRQCRFLPAIPALAAAHYPPLDEAEIGRRISAGAKNLEEASPLVRRHFGRFMRLGRVRYQRCAITGLRYLGVGRTAVLGPGWSTSRALCWPRVDVWDLVRFPLNPPAGYTALTHRIELPVDWNVVQTCGHCGGSGTVSVTETYTEYENRSEYETQDGQSHTVTKSVPVTKTRTVQRTCPSCSGAGRLEHRQYVETAWRPFQASLAEPALARPEFCDGAEETMLFDLPYLEGMQPVPAAEHASVLAGTIAAEMNRAGLALADLSDRSTPEVLRLTGSQFAFRAGFVVYGFHTLHITFQGLLSRSGWFFGRRPEFHFPHLPLSLSALATAVLAPPASLWATAVFLRWALALLQFR